MTRGVAQQSSKRCEGCDSGNRSEARFCDACGAAFGAAPNREPMASKPRHAAHGELKYGSVLFADIVGSTEMVALREPDAARDVLLPAVTVMADAIQAFGGTVNQTLGDGIMALFGVPVSQEDHALRACCAALRMHEAAAGLAVQFRLRVGIASGVALFEFGEMGPNPAFGAIVHLASRLQALAAPGATLVNGNTVDLAGAAVRVTRHGPLPIRGFAAEQHVFGLDALEPTGTRFRNEFVREIGPMVGRADEIAQLVVHANAVRAGSPVRIGLVGDAGAGKSRLAWELANRLRQHAWHVIQADAISYGRDIPFRFVASLLCSVFGIADRTAAATAVAAVRSRLRGSGDDALSAAAVLSLLDLPLGDDAAAWAALQPLQRRQAVDATLGGLLGTLFEGRAVLVLAEDMQWADAESLRLLDQMTATEGRLMLLGTMRPWAAAPGAAGPDADAPWAGRWTATITLRPLDQESMARMLAEAFPGITDPDLTRALIDRAAGNPFFLEELARDALRPALSDAVPATVQAVVAANIDRLEPEAKALLVTASAFGTQFPKRLIEATAGGRPRFQAQFESLVEAGLLRPTRLGNDFSFSHALIQEVAYAGLPRLQRRDLHARIVQAIKRVDAQRLPEMAETLTYHAGRGEVWDELIAAAGLAGDRAAARSAYSEATRFYNQAIEASAELHRTPQVVAEEVDLRFRLRSAIFPTMAITRSLSNSLIAEGLARSIGDRTRLAWATGFVAKDLQMAGRPGEALQAADRAMQMADGDPILLIAARYFGAQAHYSRGDYAQTVDSMHENIAGLQAIDPALAVGTPGPTLFFCGIWLTWAEARRGNLVEAAAAAAAMQRQADQANSPLFHLLASLSEGFALAHAGDFEPAEARLRLSMGLSRRWGISAWFMNIATALGHVLSRQGQHAEGIALHGEAVSRTRSTGILVGHAHELAWQAEAYLLSGEASMAEQAAREAIDQALQSDERGNQAQAHLALSEALSSLGDAAQARQEMEKALALAVACGMQPLIERCTWSPEASVAAVRKMAIRGRART